MYGDSDNETILETTDELREFVRRLKEQNGCRRCIAEANLMLLTLSKARTIKLVFSTTCEHGNS